MQLIHLNESFTYRFTVGVNDYEQTIVLLRRAKFSKFKYYDMHPHNIHRDFEQILKDPKVIFEVIVSDVSEASLIKNLLTR